MPRNKLANLIFLPETDFVDGGWDQSTFYASVQKRRYLEVCPRCAHPSDSTYDHRSVKLKDAPIRGRLVVLTVRKRRLWCAHCCKPFTEPLPGVKRGARTTQRYKAGILWACENFTDLSRVRKAYRCSSSYLYRALYEQLDLEQRKRQYPWPNEVKPIGTCTYPQENELLD